MPDNILNWNLINLWTINNLASGQISFGPEWWVILQLTLYVRHQKWYHLLSYSGHITEQVLCKVSWIPIGILSSFCKQPSIEVLINRITKSLLTCTLSVGCSFRKTHTTSAFLLYFYATATPTTPLIPEAWGLSPYQAILQHQLAFLQFNSILTPLAYR